VLLRIDHVVVAVRSVEEAAEVLERDLGLSVTGGGRHEAMGTYNRLAFLGDTYVELLGVFDAALVRSSSSFAVGGAALTQLEERGEGLATYALATDDVVRDVARLRAAGSSIGESVPGSRVRPDGEVVRWVCAFPELGPERPPFLIEHEAVGSEWGDEARVARAAFRHPGGGRVRLTTLEPPADDRERVAREYGTVLGIAFSERWRALLGEQSIALREGAGAGGEPMVELTGAPGTAPLDVLRFGVRWRRVPASA
jgi:catechol 2,3-dioxygenase-like lactoylglutathione lyase family enzyme